MKEEDKQITLSSDEKKELTKQSLLQLIPYVGGTLSTAYYGYKQEIRLKRLEDFYQEFSEKLKKKDAPIISLDAHDKNALIAIIEELNEKVETETLSRKREYFKNYFESILLSPTNESNYDARREFLRSLSDLSLLDCDVLIGVKQSGRKIVKDLPIVKEYDNYAVYASISKLESHGYLKSNQSDYVLTGVDKDSQFDDQRSIKVVEVSTLGEKFLKFCLDEKV